MRLDPNEILDFELAAKRVTGHDRILVDALLNTIKELNSLPLEILYKCSLCGIESEDEK